MDNIIDYYKKSKDKLNIKYMNSLIFKNFNNVDEINGFIELLYKDNIFIKLFQDNSTLSLFLKHFIRINDEHNINNIIESNIILMKRDYLCIINYFYNKDYNKSEYIFINKIISDDTILLDIKDILYIINNKLFKLLLIIDNLYIEQKQINYDKLNIINSNNTLKYIQPCNLNNCLIDNNIIYKIFDYYNNYLHDYINKLNNFNNYNLIIDGGNLLHSDNGKITDQSLLNLEYILNNINEYKPIIILHIKHIKTLNIKNLLKKNNIPYFLTPYNYYDDKFIIWFFIKSNFSSFILSNDNFHDHIYEIKLLLNNNLIHYQIYSIFKQQILKYNIKQKNIEKRIYSNCIQINDNIIYIPINNNNSIIIET